MSRQFDQTGFRPDLQVASQARPCHPAVRGVIPAAADLPTVLAPLPVSALRLPVRLVAQLQLLGLGTIGQLLRQDRIALTRRFGPQLMQRLDQALGRVDEPITPDAPAPVLCLARSFEEPVWLADQLLQAVRPLLSELLARLEAEEAGLTRLTLTVAEPCGAEHEIQLGLSRPTRQAEAVLKLLAPKLEALESDFGFERIVLRVVERAAMVAHQPHLDQQVEQAAALDHLTDTLGNRLGFARLAQLAPQASHVPERRWRREGVSQQRRQPRVSEEQRDRPDIPAHAGHQRPAQVRFVEMSTAGPSRIPLPPSRLHWRARRVQMARCWGPLRLSDEWWHRPDRQPLQDRDCWLVEDEQSRRWFIFRRGTQWHVQAAGV